MQMVSIICFWWKLGLCKLMHFLIKQNNHKSEHINEWEWLNYNNLLVLNILPSKRPRFFRVNSISWFRKRERGSKRNLGKVYVLQASHAPKTILLTTPHFPVISFLSSQSSSPFRLESRRRRRRMVLLVGWDLGRHCLYVEAVTAEVV